MAVLDNKYALRENVNTGDDSSQNEGDTTKNGDVQKSSVDIPKTPPTKTATLDDLLQRLGEWHVPVFLFGFLRGIPVSVLDSLDCNILHIYVLWLIWTS